MTICSIIEVGRAGLIQNALIKMIAETPTARNEIATASLWLSYLVSIVLVGGMWIGSPSLGSLWQVAELTPLLGDLHGYGPFSHVFFPAWAVH